MLEHATTVRRTVCDYGTTTRPHSNRVTAELLRNGTVQPVVCGSFNETFTLQHIINVPAYKSKKPLRLDLSLY